MLIIRRSKLYYTASGIITPVGGRPVHGLGVLAQKLYCTASGIITPVGGSPVHGLREDSQVERGLVQGRATYRV